jgi:hypothetical protein
MVWHNMIGSDGRRASDEHPTPIKTEMVLTSGYVPESRRFESCRGTQRKPVARATPKSRTCGEPAHAALVNVFGRFAADSPLPERQRYLSVLTSSTPPLE